MMKLKYMILSTSCILSLISCDFSSSEAGNNDYDNSLTGTWIEVKGMQGPDNRDTVSFSPEKINLGTVSDLEKHATGGQIWEDYDNSKIYKYAYKLEGDTLWMDEYDTEDEHQAKTFDRVWANGFVKIETYRAPTTVDPALIGNWIQVDRDSYRDSLLISASRFEFHHGNSEALPKPIIYGVNGPVFVREGVIGETINGVDEVSYAYRLAGDTLLLDPCSSWCIEFSKDFQPGQKYIRF